MQRLHEIIESHGADAVAVCDHDSSEISYGQLSRYAIQLVAGVLKIHGSWRASVQGLVTLRTAGRANIILDGAEMHTRSIQVHWLSTT